MSYVSRIIKNLAFSAGAMALPILGPDYAYAQATTPGDPVVSVDPAPAPAPRRRSATPTTRSAINTDGVRNCGKYLIVGLDTQMRGPASEITNPNRKVSGELYIMVEPFDESYLLPAPAATQPTRKTTKEPKLFMGGHIDDPDAPEPIVVPATPATIPAKPVYKLALMLDGAPSQNGLAVMDCAMQEGKPIQLMKNPVHNDNGTPEDPSDDFFQIEARGFDIDRTVLMGGVPSGYKVLGFSPDAKRGARYKVLGGGIDSGVDPWTGDSKNDGYVRILLENPGRKEAILMDVVIKEGTLSDAAAITTALQGKTVIINDDPIEYPNGSTRYLKGFNSLLVEESMKMKKKN